MRRQASSLTLDTGQPSISLDIHPSCQLMALAHTNGQLSIHDTGDGRVLNIIRYMNMSQVNYTGTVNKVKPKA